MALNSQIYEEACGWLVEFRAGDVDAPARRKFNAWLRISPEHVRAYLEIAAIWNEGNELDPAREYADADAAALASTEAQIVALNAVEKPAVAAKHPVHVRHFAVAASIAIAVTAIVGWQYAQRGTYRTDAGEQRSIALSDGSTVQLNSRSRIRVRYGDERRGVELLAGQALFDVAKDSARPFIVSTGDTQVRAIGTQFDVYRKKEGTVVTVIEGSVAVTDPHEIYAGALLAGQQITVMPTARPARAAAVNLAVATAWTRRQLVFETAPLAEVAEEFNRYNTRRIVIAGEGLEELQISGVFSSTDSASLVNFLRARAEIEVIESADTIRIVRSE